MATCAYLNRLANIPLSHFCFLCLLPFCLCLHLYAATDSSSPYPSVRHTGSYLNMEEPCVLALSMTYFPYVTCVTSDIITDNSRNFF